jgi:predicted ATP-grasp superfamily ATP-dependent carboligase
MILVTDAQMRQSLAIIRSLGKKGLKVIAGDSEIISTGFFSRYTYKRIVYPDPLQNEKGFVDFILNLVRKGNIEMIIPVRDKCLIPLSKHKKEFEKFTRLPFPDFTTITKARDKSKTIKIASQIGIPVPKTIVASNEEDILTIKKFPVIIKPTESSGSRGFSICHNQKELLINFRRLTQQYHKFLIQEQIPQNGEEIGYYAIFDFYHQMKAFTVQKRLRSYPIYGGPSTFRKTIKHKLIEKLGGKLLRHLRWQGVAMVEFKVDPRDNLPKLMELNPRFWGSLALSIAAGIDFPYLLYQLAINGKIEKVSSYKLDVKCRWLLPGDILWFLYSKKSWSNIKKFFTFRNTYYDVISLDDPLPILGFFLASIYYLFSKKKRTYVFR